MTDKILSKNGMPMLLLLAVALVGFLGFFWTISADNGSVVVGVLCLFVAPMTLPPMWAPPATA